MTKKTAAEKIVDAARKGVIELDDIDNVPKTPPTYAQFLAVFEAAVKNDLDKKLLELFTKNYANIKPHFEGCRGEEPYWQKNYSPSGLASHWHGPGFHKGFRQFDVIEDNSRGESDMIVWKALAGDSGPCCFWDVHHSLFNYELKKV